MNTDKYSCVDIHMHALAQKQAPRRKRVHMLTLAHRQAQSGLGWVRMSAHEHACARQYVRARPDRRFSDMVADCTHTHTRLAHTLEYTISSEHAWVLRLFFCSDFSKCKISGFLPLMVRSSIEVDNITPMNSYSSDVM